MTVNINENFMRVSGDEGTNLSVNNLTLLARIEDVATRQGRARKHKYFVESGRMQENTIR